MFFLSHSEAGFTNTPAAGTVLDYYVNATNSKRIKYNKSGSTAYWWLRVPTPLDAYSVRFVGTSGILSYSNAYYTGVGVAAACSIQ